MTTAANSADLCARIEALIQEHIAASQKAAMETLQRAFAATVATAPSRRKRPRLGASYRSKEALAELQHLIYVELQASPGLGAADLSAKLGVATAAMSRPIAALRSAGLVRSVGQRAATRYFPVSKDAASTA